MTNSLKKPSRVKYSAFFLYKMLELIKWTIFVTLILVGIIIITGTLGGMNFTLHSFSMIVIGEYQPTSFWQDIMILAIVILQLTPAFAFLEVRTMTNEEKFQLKISLLRDHIIVVGLNHIAFRARETLNDLDIPYVFVISEKSVKETDFESFYDELVDSDAYIIRGSANSTATLEKAGIAHARGILITGNDETENVIIAKKAKVLSPKIRTVVRAFRQETMNVYERTGFVDEFISSSMMVNMVYVLGCYLDIDQQYPPTIRFVVTKHSRMINHQRSEIEKRTGITILGILRNNEIIRDDVVLGENDKLFVYGDPKNFKELIKFDIY